MTLYYFDNSVGAVPKRVPEMPKSALSHDPEHLYREWVRKLLAADVPDWIKAGGLAGIRIWRAPK